MRTFGSLEKVIVAILGVAIGLWIPESPGKAWGAPGGAAPATDTHQERKNDVKPAQKAPRGYRSEALPLRCFMKDLSDWTQEDLNLGREADLNLDPGPVGESATKEVDQAGMQLYGRHKMKIERLIAEAETFCRLPIATFSVEAVKALDSKTKIIDLRYIRELSKGLGLVAFHLHHSGAQEKSLRLLSIVHRFGQIISSGDGLPPTLIQFMVGLSIQKRALGAVLWDVLRKCSTSEQGRKQIAAWVPIFKGAIGAGLDVPRVVRISFTNTTNNIERFLFDPALFDDEDEEGKRIRQLLDAVPASERPSAVKTVLSVFAPVQKRVLGLVTNLTSNPVALRRELERPGAWAPQETDPGRRVSVKDPALEVAPLLLESSRPDLAKIQDLWHQVRYRQQGLALLTGMLAKGLPGGSLPTTATEWGAAGLPLPADVYSEKGEPCLVRREGSATVLYSRGPGGVDDGGDPEKDFLLFRF